MLIKKKSDLDKLDITLKEKSDLVGRITEHVLMLSRGDREDKLLAKQNLQLAMASYRQLWPRESALYQKLENVRMEFDNTHVSGPGSHSISFVESDEKELVIVAVVRVPRHHKKSWLVITSRDEGITIENSEKKVRELLAPRHSSHIKHAEEL